jgi:hypothetical protein
MMMSADDFARIRRRSSTSKRRKIGPAIPRPVPFQAIEERPTTATYICVRRLPSSSSWQLALQLLQFKPLNPT